ncbi:MAG: ATP-binding cassette domain-containing protein [Capsulimonadales bacterium]|nr:ATP-binding cassette domain-containing protein [Capsulimonadales bacterium]
MIRFHDVSKAYSPQRFAVLDLNLEIAHGQTVALVGGSGSGKSTTLKMINRLIEPTSGSIDVNGTNVLRRDPVALRRTIGYVFQGIGLFPHMTVGENVAVIPRLLGWSSARIDARNEELLRLVRLPPEDYLHRFPSELSGGQRQRVGFARALAASPQVLLMDEPFGALDPITRDELQQEFLNLRRTMDLTVVLVTHDMTEALLLADQVAVMHEGRILRMGTPGEMLRSPGHDYVAALLETPRRHLEALRRLTGRESVSHPGAGEKGETANERTVPVGNTA